MPREMILGEHATAGLDPEAVIERVVALCEIPSASGEEDRISSRAADILRADGLDVEEQEVMPGRRNVIATLRSARPGVRLLFNGHLDTLPPAPGYTRDPYRPAIEDGRLYAAEVNNMKAAVGGMMAVMAWLSRHRNRISGEIVLSAVIGECDALGLGTVTMLEKGIIADLCINGEPTDLAVMTAHAGVSQLKLVVTGSSAHVSQRAHGVNAIDRLVRLLPGINESSLSYRKHDDFPGLPTVNVGTIRGGSLPSMLANHAEAAIDVRTVPGMTPESVVADLQRVIDKAKATDPELAAELVLASRPGFCQEPPFHIDRNAPVVRVVAAAHERVTSRKATVGTLVPQVFFGTDASHLLAAGIPTAIYGPGKVADINSPNESMAVADMVGAAQVYLASALALCATEGSDGR
jgi:acetylornithine deacetylase